MFISESDKFNFTDNKLIFNKSDHNDLWPNLSYNDNRIIHKNTFDIFDIKAETGSRTELLRLHPRTTSTNFTSSRTKDGTLKIVKIGNKKLKKHHELVKSSSKNIKKLKNSTFKSIFHFSLVSSSSFSSPVVFYFLSNLLRTRLYIIDECIPLL